MNWDLFFFFTHTNDKHFHLQFKVYFSQNIYKYNKYIFRIINKTQLDYIGLTYTIFSINELTILFS